MNFLNIPIPNINKRIERDISLKHLTSLQSLLRSLCSLRGTAIKRAAPCKGVTFQNRASMERAEIIDPGFSTADSEFPNINMNEGDLVLKFKDWQEVQREVFFSDVVAFKWQMIETFIEGEEYDRSHLITDSSWLTEHLKQGEVGAQEDYKHYKFNFNGNGQLEVISNGFTVKM